MLCPFAATTSTLIPPFCNIVQTGSSVDLTSGRLVTSSHERTAGATSDPVLKPDMTSVLPELEMGSHLVPLMRISKYHVQEGRVALLTSNIDYQRYQVMKTEDLQYSEFSSASPTIAKFSKSMDYKSGLNTL